MDHGKDMAVAFIRGTVAQRTEYDGQYRTEICVADDCFEVRAKGAVAARLASVVSGGRVSIIGAILHERWDTRKDGKRTRFVIEVTGVIDDDPGTAGQVED